MNIISWWAIEFFNNFLLLRTWVRKVGFFWNRKLIFKRKWVHLIAKFDKTGCPIAVILNKYLSHTSGDLVRSQRVSRFAFFWGLFWMMTLHHMALSSHRNVSVFPAWSPFLVKNQSCILKYLPIGPIDKQGQKEIIHHSDFNFIQSAELGLQHTHFERIRFISQYWFSSFNLLLLYTNLSPKVHPTNQIYPTQNAGGMRKMGFWGVTHL